MRKKHHTLFSVSMLAVLTAASAPAAAADASTSDVGSPEIVVSARLEKTARTEQAAAANLVNIQAAETISKYPDVNAAEALGRIAGVALSIDTAEGRFVNIRGLDGNLNGATFGGASLLNTQAGGTYFNAAGRAVASLFAVCTFWRPDCRRTTTGGPGQLPLAGLGPWRMTERSKPY